MEKGIVLVLGGARSGKSSFAEKLARRSGREVIYVATSEIKDGEMALRVKKHRAQRPAHWYTLEEPLHLEDRLRELINPTKLILLDCLTVWVSNLLLDPAGPGNRADFESGEKAIIAKVQRFLDLLEANNAPAVLVSNEVGWGIVPDNPLARAYRDIVGRVNQLCASRASKVYLAVAGLPVELKKLAENIEPLE